jgi:hypothetical protein
MSGRNQQRTLDKIQFKQGGILGAGSFIAGYVITLIVVALGEAEEITEDLIEAGGWFFYNAQLTDVELSVEGDGLEALADGTTVNYVTGGGSFGEQVTTDVPSIVYHLIPVLVLVGFGFAIARYVDAQTAEEGALAGVSLVVGTVPLSIVGTFLFSVNQDGATLAPVLTESVIFVGFLFPLVLGAVGGVLSAR